MNDPIYDNYDELVKNIEGLKGMKFTCASAFTGKGAYEKALSRVLPRHGDTCEHKYYFEIDKYKSNSYAAIHGVSEELNQGDITKGFEHDGANWVMKEKPNHEYVDIFCASPPCTTFSLAGKQQGSSIDTGKLYQPTIERIKGIQPKYVVIENVRQFMNDVAYKDATRMLTEAGYHHYTGVLNAKDYGIPQNRERMFIVAIRQDLYDQGKRFEWPQPVKLEFRLDDVLEHNVESKYYVSDSMLNKFIEKDTDRGYGFINQDTQASKVYKVDTFSQTITAGTHGYANGYIAEGVYGADYRYDEGLRIRKNGLCPALKANMKKSDNEYDISNPIFVLNIKGDWFKIRKLTPLECFRLMNFDDEDYYKAVESYDKTFGTNKDGSTKSDSKMYKAAGDSIVVKVLEEIFEQLLYDRVQSGTQISLF